MEKDQKNKADIVNQCTGERWIYSDTVKDHFFHPRNFLLEEGEARQFDAEGVVGSPACGDVMRVWVKIDREHDRVTECKWKTFGCASAIAASSMFSQMVTEKGGLKVEAALKLGPQDVMARLGGLPNRKVHCSVLITKAFEKAMNNYFRSTGQQQKIRADGSRLIDKELNITEYDIKEAVLGGAENIEDVQQKLKVGIGRPEVINEIEQLIHFYKDQRR